MAEIILENPQIFSLSFKDISNSILRPDFYSLKYIEIINKIKKHNNIELGEISELIKDGTHYTPNYLKEGIRFLSAEDISNFGVITDNEKYVNKNIKNSVSSKQNDILMVRIGVNTGFSCVNPKFLSGVYIYVPVALIRTTMKYQDYFTLFIQTQYGKQQIKRFLKTTGVPKINVEDIYKIKVPILSEKTMSDFSYLNLIESFFFYIAEALVQWIPEFTIDYLSIEMPEDSDELCFTVRPEEINEDVEYRMDPIFVKQLKNSLDFKIDVSKTTIKTLLEPDISDSFKKGVDPTLYPTKKYRWLCPGNVDRKLSKFEEEYRLGSEFTERKVKVKGGELIAGDHQNTYNFIARVPVEKNVIADHNTIVLHPKIQSSFIMAMWLTPVIQNQVTAIMRGRGRLTNKYLKNVVLPVAQDPLQSQVSHFFDNTNQINERLYFISKHLLKLGTILLEKLIEAETEEDKTHITTLLEELIADIHADIFIDDLARLPDYYDNFTSPEEYKRLIQEMPEDYQYESFEDYKTAGKYIDSAKLEALKEIVEKYVNLITPGKEQEKSRKLLDLIVESLHDSPSDLPSIISNLKNKFPEEIKPYEMELEKTVEDALRRHSSLFGYEKNFSYWKLVDYKSIEDLNLRKEGMKQFLAYLKEAEESSEAKPPDQRLLVYALAGFIDEKNQEMALEVEEFINERKLEKEEKNLYYNYRWQLKGKD